MMANERDGYISSIGSDVAARTEEENEVSSIIKYIEDVGVNNAFGAWRLALMGCVAQASGSAPDAATQNRNSDLTRALTKDQNDLVTVLLALGKASSNNDIYVEYRRAHPICEDPVRDRCARIRNVMQRNCETSKQFQHKKSIFTNPSRGLWWLTAEYAPLVESSAVSEHTHSANPTEELAA